MDQVAEIPKQSINEKAYQTRCGHTADFARRSREYAELCDQWESLVADMRRSREEADRKEQQAIKVREQLEKVAGGLGEFVALTKGRAVAGIGPSRH